MIFDSKGCTYLGFSAELQGQTWWPFCGTGSLHCGQCVKAAEVSLGHQWLVLSESVVFPQALLGGASSLV